MSHYNNGPRYTRPPGSERPGPRFHSQHQRNGPRNQFSDYRPQQQQQQQSNDNTTPKPPTDTNPPSAPVPSDSNTSAAASTNTANPSMTETSTTQETSSTNEQRSAAPAGQKRSAPNETSAASSSSKAVNQGGRSRLFIGNISPDITQDEFQKLFQPYGELVEFFVNPTRGFGFIKLASRQIAERVKQELDGRLIRGKALRIRFASQGAIVKVKNLSSNVSNELLKEAFEQYFGNVERAVVIVDDRGRSIGEGIVEFEKKPAAQKCLNECTERCFFLTSTLKPIIVEPWDTKDEEDGLPEKSLSHNDVYQKERQLKPRFAEPNTMEQTIGLKWKELELEEKQLLDEVKQRMQYASEKLQAEIDQMLLDHEAQMIREQLARHQEELRRLNERRSVDFDRRRQMMAMHPTSDAMYPGVPPVAPMSNNPYPIGQYYPDPMQSSYSFMSGQGSAGAPPPPPPPPPPAMVDANYPMARGGYHPVGHDYHHPSGGPTPADFDRKRRRY